MNATNRIRTILLMLVIFGGVSACANKPVDVEGVAILEDVSGFERDDSEAPTIIYTRPGAPGLSEFTRFIIDPVKVFYDDPEMDELSPEQVGTMQDYLSEAMLEELRDGGYEVGTRTEPNTLRVSFTLRDLRARTAAPNVTNLVFPVSVNVGHITVETTFHDAATNRLEAVVVSGARGSRFLNPSPWSTQADVRKFFDGWAKGFRESLDEAHDK